MISVLTALYVEKFKKIMVHFGSLVESSDKFKHIDVMTKVLDMALFHFRCERNIQVRVSPGFRKLFLKFYSCNN